jgi:hypothetical protein
MPICRYILLVGLGGLYNHILYFNPTHVYAENGTLHCHTTVTEDEGGDGTDTVTITVNM